METTVKPRALAEQKYHAARHNLLLMVSFTLINIVLFLINSTDRLLFSATLPYFFALGGFTMCMESPVMIPYGIITLLLAAGGLLLYFLCWIFSKKHYGWMICALVLYIFDTVAMVLINMQFGFSQIIMDVVMYIWVLYYLINGVRYGARLKTLPAEPVNQIPV